MGRDPRSPDPLFAEAHRAVTSPCRRLADVDVDAGGAREKCAVASATWVRGACAREPRVACALFTVRLDALARAPVPPARNAADMLKRREESEKAATRRSMDSAPLHAALPSLYRRVEVVRPRWVTPGADGEREERSGRSRRELGSGVWMVAGGRQIVRPLRPSLPRLSAYRVSAVGRRASEGRVLSRSPEMTDDTKTVTKTRKIKLQFLVTEFNIHRVWQNSSPRPTAS